MSLYRNSLPQLAGGMFITDGGMETTLLYHQGWDLPCFAAFYLLRSQEGRAAIRSYYEQYASLARFSGVGFIFESVTWRGSRDWGLKLGYSAEALADANREAIAMIAELRELFQTPLSPMVVSACVGPRGDGYVPAQAMSAEEAESYHSEQIGTYRLTEADMVTAMTINYAEEAIGIARAASAAGMPVAISFTLETDGRLPTGQSLKDAIESVDEATDNAPAYFMINCAHPTHFADALPPEENWVQRLRGIRANASKRSHAELDNATELDAGDPAELGREYRALLGKLPHVNVLGGCCGTDHRHVEHICRSCAGPALGDPDLPNNHAHAAAYAA